MKKYVIIMQNGLKNSSNSIFLLLFKIFTGLVLGLAVSLIGQEFFSYGNFLFYFVILAGIFTFLKIGKNWGWLGVFVFNLIGLLGGLLLRMYALMAPGTV